MLLDVIEAKYLKDFTVWVKFEDGTEGQIDLSDQLYGPIFEPLRDISYFRQLSVNPDLGTISWPNGADFAPEFLYEQAHAHV